MIDEKQELLKKLEMLPKHMQSVKDAIYHGNGYWYPLEYDYLPSFKTVVYKMPISSKEADEYMEFLKGVFEKAGISRVTGFHPFFYEDQPTWRDIPDIKAFLYEKDKYGCGFGWINEQYYYDSSEKWIIYVSHESTITFSGDDLATIAEEVIPEKYKYPT